MLVCSVSLRPPRSAIAADLVEAVTAAETLGTGNVVFATLLDDPASVHETVDAYLGEIMVEAANAGDTTDAGTAYVAAIDEAVTAISVEDFRVPMVFVDSISEAATADSLQDIAIVIRARTLSASRAGLGSTVVSDDGSGKTQIIAGIGAVK